MLNVLTFNSLGTKNPIIDSILKQLVKMAKLEIWDKWFWETVWITKYTTAPECVSWSKVGHNSNLGYTGTDNKANLICVDCNSQVTSTSLSFPQNRAEKGVSLCVCVVLCFYGMSPLSHGATWSILYSRISSVSWPLSQHENKSCLSSRVGLVGVCFHLFIYKLCNFILGSDSGLCPRAILSIKVFFLVYNHNFRF